MIKVILLSLLLALFSMCSECCDEIDNAPRWAEKISIEV